MDFRFTDEQQALREMARAFLSEASGPEQVRAAMVSERGHDPELWKRIAGELGWPAVTIPEAHGGLGLSEVELIALMEVTGEALLCAPLLSSVCLGASALCTAGTEEQKRAWLPGIAEGTITATLAHAESHGDWDPQRIEASFRREGDALVFSGRKHHVVDGQSADLVILAAREEGSRGRDGLALFLAPADTPGLERRARPTLDQTRRLAEVELDGLRLPVAARLGNAGAEALDAILQRAAIALAAEQLGGAQRCLEMAVAYAKERVQYGRPIGAFQAIKHKCADMMTRVECARSAVYYAACVAAEGGDELPLAASMAKAAASDAYGFAAGSALQIFGGVGFTWEYDIHLYFKRARSSTTLLGDVAYHRERVARAIGLDESPAS